MKQLTVVETDAQTLFFWIHKRREQAIKTEREVRHYKIDNQPARRTRVHAHMHTTNRQARIHAYTYGYTHTQM